MLQVPPERARRTWDPETFPFETTAELEPVEEIVGQDRGLEALRFGLEMPGPGYHLYVMGPPGVGKMAALRHYLAPRARTLPVPDDWCYVYNFRDPRRPRALRLPPGRGRDLARAMEALLPQVRREVGRAFESEGYRQQRQQLEQAFEQERRRVLRDLEEEARREGFGILSTPTGLAVVPLKEGRPMRPDEFAALPAEEREAIEGRGRALEARLAEAVTELRQVERQAREALEELDRRVVASVVRQELAPLREAFGDLPQVLAYLDEVEADMTARARLLRGGEPGEPPGPFELTPWSRYRVNLFVDRSEQEGGPLAFCTRVTYGGLLGQIEHQLRMGAMVTDFTLLRPGVLHRANGGYLVVEAQELLKDPLAWEGLKRALREEAVVLEEPARRLGLVSTVGLEPEPIPLQVKVILVGPPGLYYRLHALDPDFAELFQVVVDFAPEVSLEQVEVGEYASVLAHIARENELLPLHRTAVARLLEESARMAGHQERLSARFGRIAELLREANYWARRRGDEVIRAEDVEEAVQARRRRIDRLEEEVRRRILEGVYRIPTEGKAVGEVTGLAVLRVGELTFGRPHRITARVYLGRGGVVDIDREVRLGGRIYSKGSLILQGYLQGWYGIRTPLSFAASLTFEQLYEEIEGDSASAAELCALLSALGNLPLRRDLAVTGSVNQLGEIQAVGGVNEKVEGFFDLCRARGLTGTQGVILPAANLPHLMLRQDVVEALRAGRFHLYAVDHIDEILELLTGLPAGRPGPRGGFPRDSVHGRVLDRLRRMARQLRREGRPRRKEEEAGHEEGEEEAKKGVGDRKGRTG